jgi:NADH dehydrogenase FAD-containing subunit
MLHCILTPRSNSIHPQFLSWEVSAAWKNMQKLPINIITITTVTDARNDNITNRNA